jgi:hypothetical protein
VSNDRLATGKAGSRIMDKVCECESESDKAGNGSATGGEAPASTEHSAPMAALPVNARSESGADFVSFLVNPNLNKLILTYVFKLFIQRQCK